MNAAAERLLPDIQSLPDSRALAIEAVGIRQFRQPVTIRAGGIGQATIATFSMSVALPAPTRGTHMSRFVELLEERREALDARGFRSLVRDMIERLGAASGAIEMRFPLFLAKRAPVSGIEGRVDYEAWWRGAVSPGGRYDFAMKVAVPVTSLCPCSKEISEYGAHNQRSVISIEAGIVGAMEIGELIAIAERSASCEVYGILKRADEKFVTERAYENPKFAEDLVRDAALELNRDPRVVRYTVEAENFESIHNHSAYARITGPAAAAA
ncbi:MAG TPA: GTP cyclohydrolase FolE2 [Steroidobacteraceae bacterium]|nr:GTP cyclohydrolase FolE2 [Steroidobacteraceae bacterium]